MNNYQEFLEGKALLAEPKGIDVPVERLNSRLFDWQRVVVQRKLKLACGALFEECGLGKTAQELVWAEQVAQHTGKQSLILTPLAVAHQFVTEGTKFGVEVRQVRSQAEADASKCPVVVTNYDSLKNLDPSKFDGVVLDESSILKNYTGKTKTALLEAFSSTPFRLCGTATPSPNDHLELGNHAEFLGVMPSTHMIQRWFANDTMQAGGYQLKPWAAKDFWRWVASWAVCLSKPRDIGYSDEGYILPELAINQHVVEVDHSETWESGQFVRTGKLSATQMHAEMKRTVGNRAAKVREIVATAPDDRWLLWCNTDYEADALQELFPDAVEVRGSMTVKEKEIRLNRFTDGAIDMLITKPSLAGFGLNWQHCSNMAFIGLSFSFEQLYQAIRRSYRFGQTKPVNVHIVSAETEGSILDTIRAKQASHEAMQAAMRIAMKDVGLCFEARKGYDDYNPQVKMKLPKWLVGWDRAPEGIGNLIK